MSTIIYYRIMEIKQPERVAHIHTPLSRLLLPYEEALKRLTKMNLRGKIGGISTTPDTLAYIYQGSPHITFPELISEIFKDPFYSAEERRLPDGAERVPDAVVTGRILDVIEILDPEKIRYNDVVKLIIGTFDDLTLESKVRNQYLGEGFTNYHSAIAWILQNAILCDDLLIKRSKAQELFNAYVSLATKTQLCDFNEGHIKYLEILKQSQAQQESSKK